MSCANIAGSTNKHTRAPVMGADGNSKTPEIPVE